MGDSHVACCLQGGGVYVSSGTVTITSSSITGNTASGDVRAYVQNFPSPRWDLTNVLRLCFQGGGVYINSGTVTISSCTISGNTAADIVRAHIQKLSSPPWETHKCLLFAGRRCLCLFWHGHDNVFLDLREYSWLCARPHVQKFPLPRWEDC